jgi:UDP-N-acetylmuramoyl-L-alanyl-D-glutamate--2,6-diaminopimelate ligase
MDFEQILDGVEVLSRAGNAPIAGVDYDSRRVREGFVFVAMKGESTDGNRYIDAAFKAGASAVVTDNPNEAQRGDLPWAVVPHGRRALARLSANYYKHPAEKLAITGVTGTNGKTTTTFLVEGLLREAGRKNSLVGTVEYHLPGKVLPSPHTTPEALELNQLFYEALQLGATEAVMEVSSHALAQGRVFGIPYDVAIFSNLTRDHLDYHGTMESYFDSKRVMFEGCGTEPPRCAVINVEDEYGQRLLDVARANIVRTYSQVVYSYGVEKGDFHAEQLEMTPAGNRFTLTTPSWPVLITSPLLGRVNVYNVIAACAAAFARGVTLEQISSGAAKMNRVPGRFEKVDAGQPFAVVVDYAHTDDALKNLTRLGREFVSRGGKHGRVITVFGCGGDRDRAKRPLMGEAAGRGSDFVVVTSDNPRSEDPLMIINDSLPGLQRSGVRYTAEPDRRKAVALALNEASSGDIVLIAGKGHEKTQTTREGVFPFDDFEVAREELAKLGYTAEVGQ